LRPAQAKKLKIRKTPSQQQQKKPSGVAISTCESSYEGGHRLGGRRISTEAGPRLKGLVCSLSDRALAWTQIPVLEKKVQRSSTIKKFEKCSNTE
jgi:hypothetical protein